LLVLGALIMVAGTFSWVGQYIQPVPAEEAPSWLSLVSRFVLALLCYGFGLIALVMAATRQSKLREAALKASKQELGPVG
jgi:hypothetical protein